MFLGEYRRTLLRPFCFEQLENRRMLATFTVANLEDSGSGSLRQAISDANSATGPDEIVFESGLSGTVFMALGRMDITDTDDLIIQGPGRDLLTIDAQQTSGILGIATAGNVTLSGLTLTGGLAGGGAAITTLDFYFPVLSIIDCTISGNVASANVPRGGGINLRGGQLIVRESLFEGNGAVGALGYLVAAGGGAIFSAYGSVSITDSTISGNVASGNGAMGGGIFNYGSIEVYNSTISDNLTTGQVNSHGGGIATYGDLTVRHSTVTDNHVFYGAGGGTWQGLGFDPDTIVEDSVISGNSTGSGNPDIKLPSTFEIRQMTVF